MKKSGSQGQYDLDKVATGVFRTLLQDFRSNLKQDSFCADVESSLKESVITFRDTHFKEMGIVDPYYYKARTQMLDIFKKYRFEHDKYSDEELFERTNSGFLAFQQEYHFPPTLSAESFAVVQEARQIAKRILGDFEKDEVVSGSRFGKKSSAGCSYANAYIDYKLTTREAFSSSSSCAKWFKNHVEDCDPMLGRILRRLHRRGLPSMYTRTDALTLVNVPKSWKTNRAITPLQLVDLFYSYGVGEMVTKRLSKVGLDIRTLQHRHQELAKKFSSTCSHATADLSKASDSISFELLNWILPRPWLTAIKRCTTHQILVDEKHCFTHSILPMGNGFTFPVETLVFYCLIKAIGNLTHTKGIFSVYGDDLIYPSRIHKFVAVIFPQLQINLNMEKTYVRYPFRESCGGDFYRGVDVRPALFPKSDHQHVTRSQKSAFLYKLWNALFRRWQQEELPTTCQYLLTEIALTGGTIYQVPPSYPDMAGIKAESIQSNWYLPFSPVKCDFVNGSRRFSFRYLRKTSDHRCVVDELPYYWQKLAEQRDDGSLSTEPVFLMGSSNDPFSLKMKRDKCGRLVPCVASKTCVSFLNQRGSVSDWI